MFDFVTADIAGTAEEPLNKFPAEAFPPADSVLGRRESLLGNSEMLKRNIKRNLSYNTEYKCICVQNVPNSNNNEF